MLKRFCVLLGVIAVWAVPAGASTVAPLDSCTVALGPDQARQRSHKWWVSEELKAEFGITEAQSRGLEAIFQSVLPGLKSAKAEVDRHQRELSRLLSEASASEAVVVQAIDRLEGAQTALSRTRTLMLYRMYRLLTPEQRAKVQAFYDQRAKESDGRSRP